MAGALRTVWPWKETVSTRFNSQGFEVPLHQINSAPPDGSGLLLPIALAVVGAIVVLGLSRLAPPAEKK